MENDLKLITLTTGEIMDPAIATSLRYATEKGRVLYYTFFNGKIDTCQKALTYIYTVQIINHHIFQNHTHVDLNKKRGQAISAKNSTAMVSRFMTILKTDLNQT